jgi:hypothetical protein
MSLLFHHLSSPPPPALSSINEGVLPRIPALIDIGHYNLIYFFDTITEEQLILSD